MVKKKIEQEAEDFNRIATERYNNNQKPDISGEWENNYYYNNIWKNSIYFNKEYFCYMTGFIAGMPFFGDLDQKLRAKRLETPRVRVPKGSIGLTEQFCNIYTYESPGGWNIIGNTPIKIFDKSNISNPTLINSGDIVKFYKIAKEEYINWNE